MNKQDLLKCCKAVELVSRLEGSNANVSFEINSICGVDIYVHSRVSGKQIKRKILNGFEDACIRIDDIDAIIRVLAKMVEQYEKTRTVIHENTF